MLWDQINRCRPGPWTHFLTPLRSSGTPTPPLQSPQLLSLELLSLVQLRGSSLHTGSPCLRRRASRADSPTRPTSSGSEGLGAPDTGETGSLRIPEGPPRDQVQQRRRKPGSHPGSQGGRRSSCSQFCFGNKVINECHVKQCQTEVEDRPANRMSGTQSVTERSHLSNAGGSRRRPRPPLPHSPADGLLGSVNLYLLSLHASGSAVTTT